MTIRALKVTLMPTVIIFLASCRMGAIAQQQSAVPVHYAQGASHAFLMIRSESGVILGYGELLQVIQGDRVNSRLTYHFREGSVDDETTIFSQRAAFRFISDHHIQHGPFFSKASDVFVDEMGNVTIHTVKSDGRNIIEQSHIDMPPNVANGFTGTLLLNVSPSSTPYKLALVAPTGKGRLIQLSITVEGEEPFSPIAGVHRKATVFRIHPELGGIAGVVAPVIGKQPKDVFVWILEGQVPGLIRVVGPLEDGGAVVSVEPSGASYPTAAEVKR
jgi:hypothetical protein